MGIVDTKRYKSWFWKKKSLLHSESIAIERDALYANVASKI